MNKNWYKRAIKDASDNAAHAAIDHDLHDLEHVPSLIKGDSEAFFTN
jgi:hypothetical protein